MNKDKVDQKLREIISFLDAEKTFECLVRVNSAKSYDTYKKKLKEKIMQEFPFINSFSLLLSKKEIASLSNHNSIVYISSQSTVTTLMHVAKKIFHLERKYQGEGQTICIIDTGICPHSDFCLCKNRLKKFIDFINLKKECYDDNGHGTFVAGVCAGSGVLSGGRLSGIAPKADIISLKALNDHGEANSNKILEAMQWVYENAERENISVVCMSFGSDPIGLNDPIMIGAEKLWDKGIVVVAAAGNSGPEFQTIKSPGISRKVITVGGFDDNRDEEEYRENFFEIASFSSRGPCYRYFKPDLVAPAVDIMSCGKDKNYIKLSGTSVAAPMIAGICALLREKEKTATPNQIKSVLLSSCRPICYNRNLEGFGVPDLSKLFN